MSVATLNRALDPQPLTSDDRRIIEKLRDAHGQILHQLRRKIIGQEEILEQLLICFFSSGHALLVGVPGLAKTMMVRSLAEVLDLGFNRIQFTPDLMPSDVTGADIIALDAQSHERGFRFMGGPIFNNMILADEINRTPPKTLASLLEAMEEGTVHVGGVKYELPKPFFVLATQNPIEQEGTYTLPAAALDRFMFNINVDYPEEHTEQLIVEMTTSRNEEKLPVVLSREEIQTVLNIVRKVPASDAVVKYAIDLTRHSRAATTPLATVREYIAWGGSPRAAQALILGAKARAILYGREAPEPRDIRAIAPPVLRHRMIANFHADSEGVQTDDIIRHIIRECPRPHGDVSPDDERRLEAHDSPNKLLAMVWGPDNRKSREAAARRQKAQAESRIDVLARKTRKKRLSMSSIAAAVCLFLLALAMFGIGAASVMGGVLMSMSDASLTSGAGTMRTMIVSVGVTALIFSLGFVASGIGLLMRQMWGKVAGLVLLFLSGLMGLLMFAFSQGNLVPLGIALFSGIPFVMLLLQNDDDY